MEQKGSPFALQYYRALMFGRFPGPHFNTRRQNPQI